MRQKHIPFCFLLAFTNYASGFYATRLRSLTSFHARRAVSIRSHTHTMITSTPPSGKGALARTSLARGSGEYETATMADVKKGDGEYKAVTMEEFRDTNSALIALSFLVAYFIAGVAFYYKNSGWTLIQTLYFVVMTLTSVGYGDFAPTGEGNRLFTCFYIIFGIGLLGTALGEVFSTLLETKETPTVEETPAGRFIAWITGDDRRKDLKKKIDMDLNENQLAESSDPEMILFGKEDAMGSLRAQISTVAQTIVIGSIAFRYLEPDISSIDAVYYSIVTVSTVGYGDYVPQTETAELFVAVYSLIGTVVLTRSLGALAALPLERRRRINQKRVLEQYGGELDIDELGDLQKSLVDIKISKEVRNPGTCTSSEFALAMLVRQDKCTVEDIEMTLQTFAKLDIDGSGELDEDDVQRWMEEQKKTEDQKINQTEKWVDDIGGW